MMNSRIVLTASCLLAGILGGCDGQKPQEPAAGPAAPASPAPPEAQAPAAAPATTASQVPECTPSGPTDPTGEVKAGTYCVCNAGDHDEHNGMKGPHLKKGEAVVIPTLDMVTDVKLGDTTLPMIITLNKGEMNGLGPFQHQQNGAGNGNVTHMVRIIPVVITNTPVDGCQKNRNTLKISFCSKKPNGPWGGCGPGLDLGDTHVQN